MSTAALASSSAAAAAGGSSSSRPPLRIDPASSQHGQEQGHLSPVTSQRDNLDDAYDVECTKNIDPLAYYHRHMLDCHPSMDESIASDDDLLDLLRNTKDRQALKWIEDCGLPLSPNPVPITHPPWKGPFGQYNASVHSFESPTTSSSSAASSRLSHSGAAADSPETYWSSSSTSTGRSSGGSGDDYSTSSRSNTQDGSSVFSSLGHRAESSLASTLYGSQLSHASGSDKPGAQ
ncbi:hypothetical protein V8E36_005046 [Tilletia maclaganii]